MKLNFNKLGYTFKSKPLLIGGKAMEYYGLRKSGNDIDLVVTKVDLIELIKLFPDKVKDLWGDLGVCPFEFEIWKTICMYDYDFFKQNAVEKDNFLIVSLEKLLFMKTLAFKNKKYFNDIENIVNYILTKQGEKYNRIKESNATLLKEIKNITYIEKSGPEE